jgi:hypothetical protein
MKKAWIPSDFDKKTLFVLLDLSLCLDDFEYIEDRAETIN